MIRLPWVAMGKKTDTPKTEKSAAPPQVAPARGGVAGIAILAAACIVSAFGIVYVLTPTPAPAPDLAACTPGSAPQAGPVIAPAATAEQDYVELKEVLITIGSAPATRYLKMNLSVMAAEGSAQQVKAAEPMLIDAFNTYLRSLELSDFENPAFYPHLREQLARRAEIILGSEVAEGVLITEFLLR